MEEGERHEHNLPDVTDELEVITDATSISANREDNTLSQSGEN
ncbi:hypothetical protein J5U23_01809 [Saccharolobus shibatae B12]|uniref:Uncharacterized protein n=1 Tax=Saccharolobus shibatae (strain ATCC 51178 / DSM 5389 / JCM 8931 / NBRC 15437 / B12) TaxID=523848 RepID=A0A8F5BP81_SACSH|nr:hypothetical protein J5U23_01809 [Saccharolobus shibatae B12]